MSYCRFIEGDVYIFLDVNGYLSCCGCGLQEVEWEDNPDSLFGGYMRAIGEIIQTNFYNTEDILIHLQIHKDIGHFVPDNCIEGLIDDREKNDEWIKTYDRKKEREKYKSQPEGGLKLIPVFNTSEEEDEEHKE